MDPGERFAQNVLDARARRGWSQEALADASGPHCTEISLIERGGREPRLTTIVRLARALKVKPADLLEGVR